jgi:hypothetical protein
MHADVAKFKRRRAIAAFPGAALGSLTSTDAPQSQSSMLSAEIHIKMPCIIRSFVVVIIYQRIYKGANQILKVHSNVNLSYNFKIGTTYHPWHISSAQGK